MEQELILESKKKIGCNGYIYIKVNNKWKQEHRYLVEQFIGRKLTNEEKVHHDDFCKENNSISNLTLFPTGSRHNHFHRKIKQFSMTQPRFTELRLLKEAMIIERIKNNRLNLIGVYNE